MDFAALDTAAVARALAQVGDRPGDLVDGFFERLEVLEAPPAEEALGTRRRREEGLAVRLVRGDRTWMASRDEISTDSFGAALRQVARAMPVAAYPTPRIADQAGWLEDEHLAELQAFPSAVQREIRELRVAFPLKLTVRRHRRTIQVVGARLVPEVEHETFFSVEAAMPWGRSGDLLTALGPVEAKAVAARLAGLFRARQAGSPGSGSRAVVLAPSAAAVLLHEAVAHALEADVLALGGRPEAALGLPLGPETLSVLDSPATAPAGVARNNDDEGIAVCRRWLLREGKVEQPLADQYWAARSPALLPGAGRRGNRHQPPKPRMTFLEVIPGSSTEQDLLAESDGGVWVPGVSRGHLDPLSGRFTIEAPWCRRIRAGVAADPVGPCRIRGTVAGLLAGLEGIGDQPEIGGAGWCAKSGQKVPVWASTPALRFVDLEVDG